MHSTILELGEQIRHRTVSPVELTKQCLERIEQLNPLLNAFITVTADAALAQAQQAEIEIKSGHWRGPLHGIPVGLKDLLDTAGIRTTAASALFKDRIPAADAEVVRRLKNAGAVLPGKQNLHEFAYGASSVVSYYGTVHNPWNLAHIAGGSSSGSAASVAAGIGYGAIGTDTAGSIREPAALCGTVGLKPTSGRVSARGVIPLSWSLDHVGPITRTVVDAAVLLQAIAGYDAGDPCSVDAPVTDYVAALQEAPTPLRVGVPRPYFYDDLHPEISAAANHALTVMATLSEEIRDIALPIPSNRIVRSAEAFAYHAEFVSRTPELYQPETLRRIQSGARITATEYIQSRREMEQIRSDIIGVFKDIDVMVTPTVPVPPPTLEELEQNADRLRAREMLLLRNTLPVNVWGLPAISVPCGFTNDGLPIGLQIIGPHWGEAAILQLAHAYEQATAWHKRQPKIAEPVA